MIRVGFKRYTFPDFVWGLYKKIDSNKDKSNFMFEMAEVNTCVL